MWCLALLVGLSLISLSAPWRNDILLPGKLTQHHAQILKEQSDEARCLVFHGAAETGLSGWTMAAFSGGPPFGGPQSDRCLKCHDKLIKPDVALVAHTISVDTLESLTSSCCDRLGRAPIETLVPKENQNGIACSTCHREHHGAVHDLTAMSNAQCAGCHQDSFQDFGSTHPDFGNWPYERRTRIAFDHNSHVARHFPDSQKSFSCRECHTDGNTGAIVGSVSFEKACASCHSEKIKQSFGDGIPLLMLPIVDLNAFQLEDLDVGEWPADATGEFDGVLTPLTRSLLSSDIHTRAALDQFGSDFDFADIDPTNLDDLESVADIIWGMKYLISDLVEKGPRELKRRFEASLNLSLTDQQAMEMSGQLSAESIREMQLAWFPNVFAEVKARRANQPTPKPVKQSMIGNKVPVDHGWCRDDEVFGMCYRPIGHASPFVRSWLLSLGQSERTMGSDDLQLLVSQLTSNTSNGLCTTCHSSEKNPLDVTGSPIINWHAHRSSLDSKGFTRFAHEPHLILPSQKDCTSCHQPDTEANVMASYSQPDPHDFSSGFQPIRREACAECHQPKLAGDNCTMCHNYHVGER